MIDSNTVKSEAESLLRLIALCRSPARIRQRLCRVLATGRLIRGCDGLARPSSGSVVREWLLW